MKHGRLGDRSGERGPRAPRPRLLPSCVANSIERWPLLDMALFQPFRALGYITDDVPFAVQRRGTQTYVTVSVGKAWQVSWQVERGG